MAATSRSRCQSSDSLEGWVIHRKILTYCGHALTRWLLSLPYDATGAFRVFRLSAIPFGVFQLVATSGYSFFFESLLLLDMNDLRIKEVPIRLPSRTYGRSKMRAVDIFHSVSTLFGLSLRRLTAPEKMIWVEPLKPVGEPHHSDSAAWDEYWRERQVVSKVLYNLIAAFYRRFIIRPAVNYFLSQVFKPSAHLLHAGCGSGAVDVDLAKRMKITALDISPAGLTEYKRHHPGSPNLIIGSILAIPSKAGSFDGIFNLGVMEHFQFHEISTILKEFNRVLISGGMVVLFWPPKWGLTVNVLNTIHFVLNRVLRRDIILHPEEHTLIASRKETSGWLAEAGFELKQFYFGPRDAFTHQIIVAQKVGSALSGKAVE